MKGDRVVIYVDTGAQEAKTFEVVATKAGRTVDVKAGNRLTEVSELDKNGNVAHTSRFMTARIISLIEEKSEAPEEIEYKLFGGAA
jgi:hypothetical protein